jgi:hypothetical protein
MSFVSSPLSSCWNICLGHRLLSIKAVSRDKIDPKVIDGHIVPNVALFTRPAIKGRPVQTLAFSDNLKVTVSFTNESLPLPEQSGSKGTTNARHLFMTVDDRKCPVQSTCRVTRWSAISITHVAS